MANDHGQRSTPSWVAFGGNMRLFGDAAKDAFESNPENTVFDVQRLFGRKMADVDVQQNAKHWPFKVKEKDGMPVVNVQYLHEAQDFTLEEISGMILGKMKETAETYLGQRVTKAVVAVPACALIDT
jgi:heat shock protein 5